MSGLTPSQTVGPYFAIMLNGRQECRQVLDAAAGTSIVIEGQVFDGAGNAIPDALIETWQVDPPSDAHFNGYGWAHTREDGGFRFLTVKPDRVSAPDGGTQAPHILVSVMARGILTRFITRIYFEDETGNADDPVLALVPANRRDTLIARCVGEQRYRFNIVMQGAGETVFFDV
jgi:protocatechuate 3,4-dioxygenase, alpha subunit